MLSASFLRVLERTNLSPEAKILSDLDDDAFKEYLLRWSDIDRKTPSMLIIAGTVEDVVKVVKTAVDNDVPFVPSSGGHSLWSTIGPEGFILDLRQLKEIAVNEQTGRITLQSGVLVKQANDFAWEHGLCLPLGTANTAGVIPMALGGGLSTFSHLMGYASDNIISAELVTSDGRLITVSSTQHADIFYALRGAGQLFGVVTELTLQGYPISILGNSDGSVWTGAMVFSATKAEQVFSVLSILTQDIGAPTMGICIITSPPPTFDTSLIVIPVFFGSTEAAELFYRPLLDLQPFSTCTNVPYPRINDAGEAFGIKGGFKRWAGAGLDKLEPERWMEVTAIYELLKAKCPDASLTGYAIEWNVYATPYARDNEESAFGHHCIGIWAELLSWYTNPLSQDEVFRTEQEVIAIVREGQSSDRYSSYQNWSREGPLERMYPGADRLEKLRALKNEWDPRGIFTHLLL